MMNSHGRATALQELGRRLAARRTEAHLDVATLASSATVEARLIERFERGEGGLATGALTRIASVLGVPVDGLISTAAAEVRASSVEPAVKLLSRGLANLGAGDLVDVMRRARAFQEVGRLLEHKDLSQFVPAGPAPSENAHLDGYARARDVRNMLSEHARRPIRNLRQVIEDRFNILVVQRSFENPAILGAACRAGPARVIILGSALKHEAVVRMTLAHELCHHLKDLGDDGARVDDKGLHTFSMETTPEEKRANAFASMLLAPEDALHHKLGPPGARNHDLKRARDLVIRARHHFGMGFEAMAWHLHNTRYLKHKEQVHELLSNPDEEDVTGFEDPLEKDGLERRAEESLRAERISEARYRELLDLPFDAMPR